MCNELKGIAATVRKVLACRPARPINERKEKDTLAAVSRKSDQMI